MAKRRKFRRRHRRDWFTVAVIVVAIVLILGLFSAF